MIITKLRCEKCYQEFNYSFPVWCDSCKRFISVKYCNNCHNKMFHSEDFHYTTYEQRVKKIGGEYQSG